MGVDMSVAVEGQQKRRRKRKSGVGNNRDKADGEFIEDVVLDS